MTSMYIPVSPICLAWGMSLPIGPWKPGKVLGAEDLETSTTQGLPKQIAGTPQSISRAPRGRVSARLPPQCHVQTVCPADSASIPSLRSSLLALSLPTPQPTQPPTNLLIRQPFFLDESGDCLHILLLSRQQGACRISYCPCG